MTLDNILEEINKANSIVLLAHENPDGDAIGSCLAMKLALEELGKKADIIMPEYPQEFEILPGADEILKESSIKNYDLVITLDCATTKLLGICEEYFNNAKVKIVIDHHSSNAMYGDFNYVDQDAPAVCQLLLVVLGYFKVKVTKDIGTCILTGIITDTGWFQYDSVTAETFRFVADLFDKGVKVSKIYQQLFSCMPKSRFELHRVAEDRIEFLEDGKVAYTYITMEDLNKFGCKNGDHDGIVQIGRDIEGVEVSIFLRETPKGIKGSLRSKNYVNVSQLAMMFGGGGHVRAAGFTAQGTIEQIKAQVLNAVRTYLK